MLELDKIDLLTEEEIKAWVDSSALEARISNAICVLRRNWNVEDKDALREALRLLRQAAVKVEELRQHSDEYYRVKDRFP